MEEGIQLRESGIDRPILVMSPMVDEEIEDALHNNLILTIVERRDAFLVDAAAQRLHVKANVAFKLDTGLSRIGHYFEPAVRELRAIRMLPNLQITQIYSHLSSLDNELQYSRWQFEELVDFQRENGLQNATAHLAQSAVIRRPEFALDAARVGLALYGADPLASGLEPSMSFKSRLIFTKRVPKGASISYLRTFKAPTNMDIGVVGAGYANGFMRALSNKAFVLVRGRPAPVIGKVCMDQFIVDLSLHPQAVTGDEVTLFGECNGAKQSAAQLAEQADTTAYELLCLAGRLNPKNYLHSEVAKATIEVR